MNDREQRGLVIAATCKIARKGRVWICPSQSGKGKYTVCPDETQPHCSCPDHEAWGHACKHIHAVRLVIQRELFDDGREVETRQVVLTEQRTTYPQSWRAYNAAQTNEKEQFQLLLHSLCRGLTTPQAAGRGRPRIPLADAIFAACFKVYSTVSGRRFMCDLRDANEKGYCRRTPCYNSIFNIFDDPATLPVLKTLVEETAAPLKALESNFACDSSGFSGCRFDRWYDHKFGDRRIMRSWCKVHAMVGVLSILVLEETKGYYQITFGEGIGSYRGSPDVVATGPITAAILPMFGWMVGVKHQWNDSWTSNFTFSELALGDVPGQAPTNLKSTTYLAVNLIANPYERVFCGIEYLYGIREDVDGDSGSANRLQIACGFFLP